MPSLSEAERTKIDKELLEQLPKLPVPNLDHCLARYLEYAQVVATEPQFTRTKKLAESFANGPGPVLHEKLVEFAKNSNNWHNDFWLNDMYLDVRLSLPINSNPAYIFPQQTFGDTQEMLKFAAMLVCGAHEFKNAIDNRKLPVDRSTGKGGGQSMCMEQYFRMFTSYRSPARPRDIQDTQTWKYNKINEEHLIVMCKNQPYVMDLVKNGERLPISTIEHQLATIVEDASSRKGLGIPVGIVTGADRNKAAEAYVELMKDSQNADNIQKIKSCSFVLCLDFALGQASPTQEEQLAHILHGSGVTESSGNRWYDKTNQFIVTTDGINGVNFEHSVAEGIVLVGMAETALKFIDDNKYKKTISETCKIQPARRLNWKVTPKLEEIIQDCQADLKQQMNDLQLKVYIYEQYGKDKIKSWKVSPDAFIQMVLQLTHFRLHNRLVSTYESASTRRFQHGRVDNIRAAHPQALAWAKIMGDPATCVAAKKQSFEQAIQKQIAVMTENVTGHGIDNYFGALRGMAKMSGGKIPEFFEDEVFAEVFRFPLSTSQVPTVYPGTYISYGPVTPDGYGCCYNPLGDRILFAISALKSCKHTDAERFARVLAGSLDDMKSFLDKTKT